MAPQQARRRSLCLEVEERTAIVAQVAADREQEPDRGEHEPDTRSDDEQRNCALCERIGAQLMLACALRRHRERQLRQARSRARPRIDPELRRRRDTGLGGVGRN